MTDNRNENIEQVLDEVAEQGETEEEKLTPLEAVRQNQAMAQQNRDVAEQRIDPTGEVPGSSIPSDRRHHPQRQMYGQGTNES